MTLIEEVGSLADIYEEMQKPSLEVVEAIGRRMSDVVKGDKTLGVIHSEAIKRLHLARKAFSHKIQECAHRSELALDEIEVERLRAEALKADALEDLATQLMLTELRIQFGLPDRTDVGIRRGWMAVILKSDGPQSLQDVLKQLFQR